MLADVEALDASIATEAERYGEALIRLDGTVQYEMVASWAADDQADLATPVSGREYLKRRQEAADRIAAIDSKLKTVTGEIVREWRARQDRTEASLVCPGNACRIASVLSPPCVAPDHLRGFACASADRGLPTNS